MKTASSRKKRQSPETTVPKKQKSTPPGKEDSRSVVRWQRSPPKKSLTRSSDGEWTMTHAVETFPAFEREDEEEYGAVVEDGGKDEWWTSKPEKTVVPSQPAMPWGREEGARPSAMGGVMDDEEAMIAEEGGGAMKNSGEFGRGAAAEEVVKRNTTNSARGEEVLLENLDGVSPGGKSTSDVKDENVLIENVDANAIGRNSPSGGKTGAGTRDENANGRTNTDALRNVPMIKEGLLTRGDDSGTAAAAQVTPKANQCKFGGSIMEILDRNAKTSPRSAAVAAAQGTPMGNQQIMETASPISDEMFSKALDMFAASVSSLQAQSFPRPAISSQLKSSSSSSSPKLSDDEILARATDQAVEEAMRLRQVGLFSASPIPSPSNRISKFVSASPLSRISADRSNEVEIAPVSASYAPDQETFARFKVCRVEQGTNTTDGSPMRMLFVNLKRGAVRDEAVDGLTSPSSLQHGLKQAVAAGTTAATTPLKEFLIALSGQWSECTVIPGDVIHVVWSTRRPDDVLFVEYCATSLADRNNATIHITDDENFLIVRPDLMVCPTRVADANSCFRRVALMEQTLFSSQSKDTVRGSAKHDLFQIALNANRFDDTFLQSTIPQVVRNSRTVEGMFMTGMTEEELIEDLNKCIDLYAKWGETFVGTNATGIKLDFRRAGVAAGGKRRTCRIVKVLATEEMIWSPMWGLKGSLDATVVLEVEREDQDDDLRNVVKEYALTPIELKTGRGGARVEYHAQLALYSLLLGDRYRHVLAENRGSFCRAGLLILAPHTDEKAFALAVTTTAVATVHGEIRALLVIRNRIAVMNSSLIKYRSLGGLSDFEDLENNDSEQDVIKESLPRLTGNVSGECDRCHSRDSCGLIHVALENGSNRTMRLKQEEYDNIIGSLKDEDLVYYSKWQRMLDYEDKRNKSRQQEIWRRTAALREFTKRCVGNLKLNLGATDKMGRVLLEFSRIEALPIPSKDLLFDVGDLVCVGVQDSQIALTVGVLVASSSRKLIVRVSSFPAHLPNSILSSSKWRVDLNEILWGNKFIKGILGWLFVSKKTSTMFGPDEELTKVQMAQKQSQVHKELIRDWILARASPSFFDSNNARFIRDATKDGLKHAVSTKSTLDEVRMELATLFGSGVPEGETAEAPCSLANAQAAQNLDKLTLDQLKTVAAVLAAIDFVCIKGSPGSGKTTTIAAVVQTLHALGKSVLVTSFTHAACDNLLYKIKSNGVPVLRIAKPGQARKELRASTLREDVTVDDLRNYLNDPALICGSTCLGVKHPLLQKKFFDYCVVDEAGHLSEPVALGPMARARCIIFVGDEKQLPPLVVSSEAKALGMDKSLFERLADGNANAVVALTTQFRMNADINALANELFYHGVLTCGSKETEMKRLKLPFWNQIVRSNEDRTSWLFQCVDPEKSVVFLNTDGLTGRAAKESRGGSNWNASNFNGGEMASQIADLRDDLVVNHVEALLVHLIVDRMARCGLNLNDLGVISPYRAQLQVLRKRLGRDVVEVDTVDKFQGRDKDCIVVSLVRSNQENKVGNLLTDWRRINVAFTRAKCKLIVVGSASTLSNAQVCAKFLTLVKREKWDLSMSGDDHLRFPDPQIGMTTQSSVVMPSE